MLLQASKPKISHRQIEGRMLEAYRKLDNLSLAYNLFPSQFVGRDL
jgi:hypothetical protein